MKIKVRLDQVSAALKVILAVASVVYLVVYGAIAFRHLSYPFELEWMEGGTVDHVARVVEGKSLYVEPSVEFVPYVYPPLFYYASALSSEIFGMGFMPLRLVSFLSSIGCFLLIFAFVKRETMSSFLGLLSAGLFAATYKISGAWFDIARVDSFFLFLTLAGLYLLRFHKGALAMVSSGLFFFLACFSKQSGLIIAVAMSCYAFVYLAGWRKYVLALTVSFCVLMSTMVMDRASGGWYSFYVFELPAGHNILWYQLLTYWIRDFSGLSAALLFSTIVLFLLLRRPKRVKNGFYCFLFVSMIGTSWLSRMHSGGYLNVLMPAYAALAIFFGLGIEQLSSGSIARYLSRANIAPGARKVFEVGVLALCLIQFHSLVYRPNELLPTDEDIKAGAGLVHMLKAVKGEVFLPFHGYLSSLAGKRGSAHWMAIGDVLRGGESKGKTVLRQRFAEAMNGKRFEAIVTDNTLGDLENDLRLNYLFSSRVFDSHDVFWTVTGSRTRPESIYTPAPPRDGTASSH